MHREGDKPAVIWSEGTLEWYKNGILHRTNRPAIVRPDGSEEYWINGNRVKSKI